MSPRRNTGETTGETTGITRRYVTVYDGSGCLTISQAAIHVDTTGGPEAAVSALRVQRHLAFLNIGCGVGVNNELRTTFAFLDSVRCGAKIVQVQTQLAPEIRIYDSRSYVYVVGKRETGTWTDPAAIALRKPDSYT